MCIGKIVEKEEKISILDCISALNVRIKVIEDKIKFLEDVVMKPNNYESTDEYFYRDIVSVSTSTDTYEIKLSKGETITLKEAVTFKLTTSGGNSVSALITDPELIKKMGGGDIPTDQADSAIQVIRKMLREKKSSN